MKARLFIVPAVIVALFASAQLAGAGPNILNLDPSGNTTVACSTHLRLTARTRNQVTAKCDAATNGTLAPSTSTSASTTSSSTSTSTTTKPTTDPAPAPSTSDAGVPAPVNAGKSWVRTFDESFSGSDYDHSKLGPCFDWNAGTCTGSFNSGREWYDGCMINVSNGTAKLTAAPIEKAPCTNEHAVDHGDYLSGLLSTARPINTPGTPYRYTFTYGYVEARLKVPPQTPGFFTAFWMLDADPTYKYSSEFDILEMLGNDASTPWQTYHGLPDRSVTLSVQNPDQGPNQCAAKRYDDGFHTFGADWEPNSFAFYIDGHECRRWNVKTETRPMQLILDLMVDHAWETSWGSHVDPVALPTRTLEADYIRVWQQK